MFGMSIFGSNIFGMSENIPTIDEPEFNKQWVVQCKSTSTWTPQTKAVSERRNTCNTTLNGVAV